MARVILAFVALMFFAAPALAQEDLPALPPRAAPTAHIQSDQLAVMDSTPNFDAARATAAYLARVSGEARARSDAYFEGGYSLMLLDLLWSLAIAVALLWLGISAAIRDWAMERTHDRVGRMLIYVLAYAGIVAAAQFPLALYEGYFREHAYGSLFELTTTRACSASL